MEWWSRTRMLLISCTKPCEKSTMMCSPTIWSFAESPEMSDHSWIRNLLASMRSVGRMNSKLFRRLFNQKGGTFHNPDTAGPPHPMAKCEGEKPVQSREIELHSASNPEWLTTVLWTLLKAERMIPAKNLIPTNSWAKKCKQWSSFSNITAKKLGKGYMNNNETLTVPYSWLAEPLSGFLPGPLMPCKTCLSTPGVLEAPSAVLNLGQGL